MNEIQELIAALQVLIAAGAVGRILYCLMMINADGEEDPKVYKVRIRNVLVFTVLAESIGGILQIVQSYVK